MKRNENYITFYLLIIINCPLYWFKPQKLTIPDVVYCSVYICIYVLSEIKIRRPNKNVKMFLY